MVWILKTWRSKSADFLCSLLSAQVIVVFLLIQTWTSLKSHIMKCMIEKGFWDLRSSSVINWICDRKSHMIFSAVSLGFSALQLVQFPHCWPEAIAFWQIEMTPVCCCCCALTGHFISYTSQLLVWTPFCPHSCLHSSWCSVWTSADSPEHIWIPKCTEMIN